jgi:multiple sugar transport system substrate-binding protein
MEGVTVLSVRGLQVLGCSALLLLLATACNPAADRDETAVGGQAAEWPASLEDFTGEIDVWGFGTDDAIGRVRLEAFEEQHPNVVVSLTPGDFDPQAFLSAVAAGNPPDVIHIERELVGSYADRDALEPLDELIEASGFDVGVFQDAALRQVQFEDQTWGMPQFSNVIMTFLNDSVLANAGAAPDQVDFADWDGLAQLNEQMAAAEGGNVQTVGVDPKLPEFLPLWTMANGTTMISEDGRTSQLDSPEVAEALEYAVSLYEPIGGREPYQAFSATWDLFGEANPIVEDQVGVYPIEQWYLNVLGEATPDADVVVRPFTDREGEPLSYLQGNSWALPAGSDNAQTAFEFMRFMSETDTWVAAAQGAKQEAEAAGQPYLGTYTANSEADRRIADEVFEPTGDENLDRAVETVLQMQEQAVSLPVTPAGAEIDQAVETAVNQAMLGQASAEEALAAAHEEVQSALDEAWES